MNKKPNFFKKQDIFEKDDDKYKCKVCDETFTHKFAWIGHIKIHKKRQPRNKSTGCFNQHPVNVTIPTPEIDSIVNYEPLSTPMDEQIVENPGPSSSNQAQQETMKSTKTKKRSRSPSSQLDQDLHRPKKKHVRFADEEAFHLISSGFRLIHLQRTKSRSSILDA